VTIPAIKQVIPYPGSINYENYPGCKLEWFPDAGALNAFCQAQEESSRPILVVNIFPGSGYEAPEGRLSPGLYLLYTTTLDDKTMEDLESFNQDWSAYKAQRDAARKEQQAKADEAKVALQKAVEEARAEATRLAEVGRRCEANHAKAIADKRESKKGKKS
jgi:hypothetical protein